MIGGVTMGAIHLTKISGNFRPKLDGSARSNRKSFEKTGPPFEVDHFSRSDQLEILVEWIAPHITDKPTQVSYLTYLRSPTSM